MTDHAPPETAVARLADRFVDHAIAGERSQAVALTVECLERGASPETVVLDLLAGAQRECGERWAAGRWTVADEHLVTGVTQRCLDALADRIEPTPAAVASVVVVCAEGDWHALPSQMCAELLRIQGCEVAFLGASTPSDHVGRLLARDRPDALVVTCNLPLFFHGVSQLADAAHARGIPVLAGGRALGHTPGRALVLGADAWAPDPIAATAILRVVGRGPTVASYPVGSLDAVSLHLDVDSTRIADEAFHALVAGDDRMRLFDPRQLARTREDLAFIVRFAAAALLVDDPRVFHEFLTWLRALLAGQNVPVVALSAGLDAILAVLRTADDQRPADLVAQGLVHLSEAG